MPDPVVLVDVADRIATITLNRPEARNALSRALGHALWDAVGDAGRDPDIDAVVLTGADPAFSAGVDLKEVSGEIPPTDSPRGPGDGPERFDDNGLYRFIPLIPKPVIGAINGVAVTGGLELALQCTFLVASDRARFADTHARVGIMPGGGITVLLARWIGLPRAIEMSLSGNFVAAEEALRLGLVNHVVPHDELLPFARGLAADIVSNDQTGVRRLLAHYRRIANASTLDEAHLIEGYMAEQWTRDASALADRRQAVTERGRGGGLKHMPGALEGLRVVDLTTGLAGPIATMMLSDHGADVVKVEPAKGDPQRAYVGSVVTNRGKRSVVLDLDDAGDRQQLLALIDTADVLVESFAPGHLAARGLDFERVAADRPSLIYCSLTGYPRTTDAADRPAIDLLVQARSGMQYEQPGFRDGPIFLHAPLPSIAASYLTVEGILAALYARELTGRGQWVETSLYQGVLSFTTQLWQDPEHRVEPWFEIGFEPRPSIYECADGLWVHSMHFAGGRGKDRSIVWEILGIDAPSVEWNPTGGQAFDDVIRDAIGKMKRQDLLDQFWANEIAIAPVRHAHEALEDEQVINNGMSVVVDDPVHGPVRQAGISFRLHGAPTPAVQGPQPAVGQHTDEVLAATAKEPARAREPRPAKRSVTHALEGIKILDLGNFLAGPFGPMLLGDLGATVYKLESPQGDQMRPVTQPFNGCQRGKLDVVVDLKQPEGVEIAHRLMREVDVVHHNMRPGVAERLGVDYETAKRLNPNVIYCHTTMWGNDGPRATWPGFDQLAESSCGLEQELGGEGNGPNWYRFGMCDQACAVQSALAVLMALYWRERTGEGQLVDTSIVNGGVQLNTDAWIGPDGWSERPRTDADQTGFGPLYRLYEASDGWLAIACLGDTHRGALASVVPALDVATLEAFFAARTAQESFDLLDGAGVPVELAPEDAGRTWFTQPDLVAAGLVADYEHPTYGRFRQFGELVHLSDTPGRIAGPPPLLGQHSHEVLSDLGYSDAEIQSLRDRGVTLWPA